MRVTIKEHDEWHAPINLIRLRAVSVPPVLSLFVAGDISIRALSEKLMEHEAEARGSSRVDIVVGGRTLRSQR